MASQKQLFVDESPTKEKKIRAWLWVAVAPLYAVFGVFLDRKRESLRASVGDYSGVILNCDRAKMHLDGMQVQWCWAHLEHDIQSLIDSYDGQVKRLGHDLLRQQKLLFQHWRRYQAGKIDWSAFQSLVQPVRQEFDALLLRGCFSGNRRLMGMCKDLHARRDWLWTFTVVPGIEPTNNAAERALRPAVIFRDRHRGYPGFIVLAGGPSNLAISLQLSPLAPLLRELELLHMDYRTFAGGVRESNSNPRPSPLPPHEPHDHWYAVHLHNPLLAGREPLDRLVLAVTLSSPLSAVFQRSRIPPFDSDKQNKLYF